MTRPDGSILPQLVRHRRTAFANESGSPFFCANGFESDRRTLEFPLRSRLSRSLTKYVPLAERDIR